MNQKLHSILVLLSILMAGMYAVSQIQLIGSVGTVIILFLLARENKVQDFYTLLAISPFLKALCFLSWGVDFVIVAIALAKLIVLKRGFPSVTVLLGILVLLYAINEFSYFGDMLLSQYVLSVCDIGYLVFFLLYFSDSNYNHRYAVTLIFVSYVLNQLFSFLIVGDLSAMTDSAVTDFRLGEGDVENGLSNSLGGAMGFPQKTILGLTLVLPCLFGKHLNTKLKFIIGIVVLVQLIVSFFTTSRVYILGLVTLVIMLLFYIMRSNRQLVIGMLLFSLLGVLFISRLGSPIVELVFDRYEARNEGSVANSGDITTGRTAIYNDCFEYLERHPLRWIVGCGNQSYRIIGAREHSLMSASAHNGVLDAIMSYGVLGCAVIIMCSVGFTRRLRVRERRSDSLLGWMPMVCWFVMNLTASPFILAQTFIQLPLWLLHIRYYPTLMVKSQE